MAYLKKDAPADVVETLRQARSTGRRVLARSADPEHATRHAGADEDRPPGVVQEERLPLCRKRSGLFVLHVRVEDAFAHGVLRRRVDDRPQEREAPALAVDRVLARRERDVPSASTPSALPPQESAAAAPRSIACGPPAQHKNSIRVSGQKRPLMAFHHRPSPTRNQA